MQTVRERGASEGVRDKNTFLSKKSGEPSKCAGAGWKAKVREHFRMMGEPKVDDRAKYGQTHKEPITGTSRAATSMTTVQY